MCLGDKFDHAEECLCLLSEINLFSPLLSSLIFGVQQTTINRKKGIVGKSDPCLRKKRISTLNITCNVVHRQLQSIQKCQIFAVNQDETLKSNTLSLVATTDIWFDN